MWFGADDRQQTHFVVHLNEAFAAKQRVLRAASWPANSASVLHIVPPVWLWLLTGFLPFRQVLLGCIINIVISSHLLQLVSMFTDVNYRKVSKKLELRVIKYFICLQNK